MVFADFRAAREFAQLWDEEEAQEMVDEPLAALDPGLQLQLMDARLGFARTRGHAVLAILHDVNQALRDFERLLLVQRGALAGDMAVDVAGGSGALAALERLYGVRFASAMTADGECVTAAVRALEPA